MSSKNIDRVYQEKLKDLEMNPDSEVWNRISGTLEKPKKTKKRILWWFASVGSAAAVLLLVFLNTDPVNKKVKNVASSDKVEQNTPKWAKEKKELVGFNSAENDSLLNSSVLNKYNTKKRVVSASASVRSVKEKRQEIARKVSETLREQPITKKLESHKGLTFNNKSVEVRSNSINNFESDKFQNTQIDTTTSSKKSLRETLLAEKNQEESQNLDKEKMQKTWSVAPVVSQYVYNSFSDNSTIDTRLNSAEKSGESNISYGFNVAYTISKKLKIRAGIHSLSMAQNTQKESLSSSFSRVTSYENTKLEVVEISTNSTTNNFVLFTDVESVRNSDIKQITSNSSQLEQRFGYIEIPVDVNYSLFATKRFSFYVSGGFSTLFLTENSLVEENSSFSQSLGGATNVNNINFSVNFGTDLEYHFSKKWFINLNPSIKIQTQTFSKDSNQPYLLGVSSGINYKF